jgi:hypothetical protein
MSVWFDHPNFNVPVGKTETRQFRVVNDTISEQDWQLTSSVDWIKIEPTGGKLAPGTSTFVKLTATPSDRVAVTHETTFTFVGAGGVVSQQIASRTFVLPPYKDPGDLPLGRIARVEKVDPKIIKFHKIMARGDKAPTYGGGVLYPQAAPLFGHQCRDIQPIIGKKRFDRAMWVTPAHETVYNLEGTGFTTFAAYVGVPVDAAKSVIRHHHRRVNFEVYLDGKIVVQSGLMTTLDQPRLLVVEGLDKAKEMKLVTRLDSDRDNNSFLSVWANAEFYQKQK